MCNAKLNILLPFSLEISSDVIEFVVSFGHSFSMTATRLSWETLNWIWHSNGTWSVNWPSIYHSKITLIKTPAPVELYYSASGSFFLCMRRIGGVCPEMYMSSLDIYDIRCKVEYVSWMILRLFTFITDYILAYLWHVQLLMSHEFIYNKCSRHVVVLLIFREIHPKRHV